MSTVTVTDPVKSSEAEEFEKIYRAHAALVYRMAWGVLGSREDAEDVLQTIFLKLLRRELPPDLQRNPKAYLYKSAVNLSLDILKARRRRPELVHDTERVAQPISEDSSFEEDLQQQLYEAIGQLRAEAAEVIVLHYIQKKSTAEI